MSVMVKKHVNLPAGLDSLLKKSVEDGCFASEAEAFRTAITLLLFELQRISPMADYRLLSEVSQYIELAKERAKGYQLVPAIEQMTIASDIMKNRMSISLLSDGNKDFVTNIRVLNTVFVDCLSVLRKLAKKDYPRTKLENAYREYELIENLDFLVDAYKGLGEATKKEGKPTVNSSSKICPTKRSFP
jgi:Arc/MetJ-type ribon-helix-helix transcriptional regulator